jgi:hypothetical protein
VAGVGAGIWIAGRWSERPEQARQGRELAGLGLTLFVIFGALMEFIYSNAGVSERTPALVFAILLTLLSIYRLARVFIAMGRVRAEPDWGKRSENRDLFWPVILLGLGLLWTLAALGVLPGEQALALLNLWPLILIAAGLFVAFGRRSPWVGGAIAALLVVILFAAAFLAPRLGLDLRPSWMTGGFSGAGIIRKRVTGSGTITTEARPISGFDKIDLQAGGAAEIIVGDTEGIEIHADDNLLPYLETDTRGGVLVIRVQRGVEIKPSETVQYRILVKTLEGIAISGAGEARLDGLQGEHLALGAAGLGSFTLHNLEIGRLEVEISGSGSAAVEGTADDLDLRISGSGSLEAGDLQARMADVRISGAGQALVWTLEQLTARISGSGRVSYYGSPDVNKEISGAGSVDALGEK